MKYAFILMLTSLVSLILNTSITNSFKFNDENENYFIADSSANQKITINLTVNKNVKAIQITELNQQNSLYALIIPNDKMKLIHAGYIEIASSENINNLSFEIIFSEVLNDYSVLLTLIKDDNNERPLIFNSIINEFSIENEITYKLIAKNSIDQWLFYTNYLTIQLKDSEQQVKKIILLNDNKDEISSHRIENDFFEISNFKTDNNERVSYIKLVTSAQSSQIRSKKSPLQIAILSNYKIYDIEKNDRIYLNTLNENRKFTFNFLKPYDNIISNNILIEDYLFFSSIIKNIQINYNDVSRENIEELYKYDISKISNDKSVEEINDYFYKMNLDINWSQIVSISIISHSNSSIDVSFKFSTLSRLDNVIRREMKLEKDIIYKLSTFKNSDSLKYYYYLTLLTTDTYDINVYDEYPLESKVFPQLKLNNKKINIFKLMINLEKKDYYLRLNQITYNSDNSSNIKSIIFEKSQNEYYMIPSNFNNTCLFVNFYSEDSIAYVFFSPYFFQSKETLLSKNYKEMFSFKTTSTQDYKVKYAEIDVKENLQNGLDTNLFENGNYYKLFDFHIFDFTKSQGVLIKIINDVKEPTEICISEVINSNYTEFPFNFTASDSFEPFINTNEEEESDSILSSKSVDFDTLIINQTNITLNQRIGDISFFELKYDEQLNFKIKIDLPFLTDLFYELVVEINTNSHEDIISSLIISGDIEYNDNIRNDIKSLKRFIQLNDSLYNSTDKAFTIEFKIANVHDYIKQKHASIQTYLRKNNNNSINEKYNDLNLNLIYLNYILPENTDTNCDLYQIEVFPYSENSFVITDLISSEDKGLSKVDIPSLSLKSIEDERLGQGKYFYKIISNDDLLSFKNPILFLQNYKTDNQFKTNVICIESTHNVSKAVVVWIIILIFSLIGTVILCVLHKRYGLFSKKGYKLNRDIELIQSK